MEDQNTNRPAEFEGRLSQGKDWREIVAWVGDLPPMPQVASRAIKLVEDPNTNNVEFGKVLQTDAALTARVLKIANSAMFCRQREITTVSQAIMVIGLKTLKSIIVAATLRQMNRSLSNIQKTIWQNSIASAMFAVAFAKKMNRPYTDEIFTLALLHTLGQIVLLSQADLAKDYVLVLKEIKEKGIDYATAEQEVFGFAHPLIGALVAKKWNFASDACQVILHYKDPLEHLTPDLDYSEKAMLVQLADLACHYSEIGTPTGYVVDPEKMRTLALKLGIASEEEIDKTLQNLIDLTAAQFENEKNLYE